MKIDSKIDEIGTCMHVLRIYQYMVYGLLQMIIRRIRTLANDHLENQPLANDHLDGPATCK